ncbi:hypothetical protein N7465_003373 [Penicillium sp. CMV-2018d]|nr:hypothetical protein N7465_003373 [Penicillium sp. CMV-2018d]
MDSSMGHNKVGIYPQGLRRQGTRRARIADVAAVSTAIPPKDQSSSRVSGATVELLKEVEEVKMAM